MLLVAQVFLLIAKLRDLAHQQSASEQAVSQVTCLLSAG